MEGGTQCATATASTTYPGAATKECDVCTCTQTGILNGYGQSTVGCGDHAQNGYFYCYAAVSPPVSRLSFDVFTTTLRAGWQHVP